MESLVRPEAPTPLSERVRSSVRGWLRWFGVGRLVASAFAVVAVAAGGHLLLRAPTPPAEATLPYATGPDRAAGIDPAAVPGSTVAGADPTAPAGGDGSAGDPRSDQTRDGSEGDATATAGPVDVVVHVAGAVRHPGVYRLPLDARVNDALTVAGGATASADPDLLNLAAPLLDGSRIYVPELGEEVTELVTAAPSALRPSGAAGDSGSAGGAPPELVDVNRAGPAQLEQLPGVGPATAAAIIAERDRNGPFAAVDDLERVPGIGPSRLDALRDLVTT